MELLLMLLMVWNSLTSAADAKDKADAAAAAARAQLEASVYAGREDTGALLQAETALLPAAADQGDAVLVHSKHEGSIAWQGKTYTLQPFGNGYYALLPISMDTKPGNYAILGQALTVRAKRFPEDRLTVTGEQEAMKQNTERIDADQKIIDAARSKSLPTFQFNSPFVMPVQGRLSTPYGYTRYVNGKYDGSHRAIDLAAPEGTPVKATNAGTVVLAAPLYLTGNSIYIDHGMNLFSQYAHLSKLMVKTGDHVAAGDVIGLVGTTGFSTGPHLHFTFWIGNDPVNPNLFFNTTPFLWRNKQP